MTRFFLLSLMIIGAHTVRSESDTLSRNPAEMIYEQFSSIDSISAVMAATAVKSNISEGYVDSLARSILDNHQVIHGITLFDKSGAVTKSYDRSKRNISIQNVTSKKWFAIPSTERIPFFGGIVQANSRNCMLKSYPLALNTYKNNSNGVLVILVDVALFLEQFGQPLTVKYKTVQLYSTSSGNAELPSHAVIPGYPDLEISYGSQNSPAITGAGGTTRKSDVINFLSTPSPIVYLVIVLLLGLTSFACGRYYLKKYISQKLLEMEYEKISKEQQKQIHDRALSQVYCEIRRQIETHEMGKIEDEIRHKIEQDIREKVLVG